MRWPACSIGWYQWFPQISTNIQTHPLTSQPRPHPCPLLMHHPHWTFVLASCRAAVHVNSDCIPLITIWRKNWIANETWNYFYFKGKLLQIPLIFQFFYKTRFTLYKTSRFTGTPIPLTCACITWWALHTLDNHITVNYTIVVFGQVSTTMWQKLYYTHWIQNCCTLLWNASLIAVYCVILPQ